MDSAQTVREINRYAQHAAAKKFLRSDAWGSYVFGALAVIVGVRSLPASQLNLILIGIGALLIVSGTMSLRRPGLDALILSGTGMLMVAGWNILIFILNTMAGDKPAGGLLVLGVAQILWGLKIFGARSRMAAQRIKEPPSSMSSEVEAMLERTRNADEMAGEDHVMFTSVSFWGGVEYRGWLTDTMAVFADPAGTRAYCATPEDVSFALKGSRVALKNNKGTLRIGDESHSVSMSQTSVERIRRWLEKHVSTGFKVVETGAAHEGDSHAAPSDSATAAAGSADTLPSQIKRLEAHFADVTFVHGLRKAVRAKCVIVMVLSAIVLVPVLVAVISALHRAGLHGLGFGSAISAPLLLFVLAAAIAGVAKPTPRRGMVAIGSVAAICATWTLCVLLFAGEGRSVFLFPAILTAVAGQFAIKMNASRREYDGFMAQRSASDDLVQAEELLVTIARSKPKGDLNAVTFREPGHIVGGRWKGMLTDDSAVFVKPNLTAALAAPLRRVSIEGRKGSAGRSRKVTLRVGTTVMSVSMPAESRRRLTERTGAVTPAVTTEVAAI